MKKVLIATCILLFIFLTGCDKEFLDKKPNKALLVPTTLADFQALIDNTLVINVNPSLNIISGDELHVTNDGTGLNALQRNTYYWEKDIYEATTSISDWDVPYKQIFHANIILDGLLKLERTSNPEVYDRVKGNALFIRAYAAYNISQLFSAAFSSTQSESLPGIPLPISSDVNKRPGRGTQQATYNQIISDLRDASKLLPISVPFKSRANKGAAFGLMARVYLTMQDYKNAALYANESLLINSSLINYNSLNKNETYPFPAVLPNGNSEVLYYSENISYALFRSAIVVFNPDLIASYDQNDLRKLLYFIPNNGRFRGYTGIAVDEVYLIRAEANCRLDNLELANRDLNHLLQNRYITGYYNDQNIKDKHTLLDKILLERRKELVFRGLRWSDLRRLNQEADRQVTIKRLRNNQEIILPPSDPRYTFPIPASDLGDGVE